MRKSDPRWNDETITSSCGNVFVDLGFHPAEAELMRLKIELTACIKEQSEKNGWTALETAQKLGVSDQVALQLINGKLEGLNDETIVTLAAQMKIMSI